MRHKARYHVFTRVWWKRNAEWPDGREPHMGRKTTINYFHTEESARAACKQWNAQNDPGPMSRKAEYEDSY